MQYTPYNFCLSDISPDQIMANEYDDYDVTIKIIKIKLNKV